jgi:hypothetical protein
MFAHLVRSRQRGLGSVEYVIVLVLLVAVAAATWRHFGLRVKCALQGAYGEIDSHLSGTAHSLPAQESISALGVPPDSKPPGANSSPPAAAETCGPNEARPASPRSTLR